MSKCVMCLNTFEGNDQLDNGLPICPVCAKRIDTLEHSENIASAKRAYHYVFNCAEQTNNPRVSSQLSAILNRHPALAESESEHPLFKGQMIHEKQYPRATVSEEEYTEMMPYKSPGIYYIFKVCGIILWIFGGLTALIILFLLHSPYTLLIAISAFSIFFFEGAMPLALAHILDKLSKIEYNTSHYRK